MIGIDIYDCVVVINTREALEAFTKTRMSLGSDLAVVAGPWGAGGSVDFAAPQGSKGGNKAKDGAAGESGTETTKGTEGTAPTADATSPYLGDDKVHDTPPVVAPTTSTTCTAEPAPEPPRRLGEYTSWGGSSKKKQSPSSSSTPARPDAGDRKPSALKQAIKQPTYSYVKSRGFYAGVQVDGTIVTERKDANAAFYGEPVAVQQILKGEVPLVPGKEKWAELVKPLFDTIKGAEGWHAQSSSSSSPGGEDGKWANQMGPDPNSTYGAAYDPVFDKRNENNNDNPPPKPPRPTSGSDGVTEGVANMNLNGGSFPATAGPSMTGAAAAPPPPSSTEETPGARAKAAEAAAEAEMNREREERERRELAGVADPRASMATAPPGYSAMAGDEGSSPSQQAATVAEDMPPAYVDEGGASAGADAARSGAGDTKSPAGPGGQ